MKIDRTKQIDFTVNTLTIHPTAELNPFGSEAELDKLISDIAQNGQKEPIYVTEDTLQIVDGRRRSFAIRKIQGLDTLWGYYVSDYTDIELAGLVRSVETRRNLNTTQRAIQANNFRQALGWSQRQTSYETGISVPTLVAVQWLSEHRPQTLEKLARREPAILPNGTTATALNGTYRAWKRFTEKSKLKEPLLPTNKLSELYDAPDMSASESAFCWSAHMTIFGKDKDQTFAFLRFAEWISIHSQLMLQDKTEDELQEILDYENGKTQFTAKGQ